MSPMTSGIYNNNYEHKEAEYIDMAPNSFENGTIDVKLQVKPKIYILVSPKK